MRAIFLQVLAQLLLRQQLDTIWIMGGEALAAAKNHFVLKNPLAGEKEL